MKGIDNDNVCEYCKNKMYCKFCNFKYETEYNKIKNILTEIKKLK